METASRTCWCPPRMRLQPPPARCTLTWAMATARLHRRAPRRFPPPASSCWRTSTGMENWTLPPPGTCWRWATGTEGVGIRLRLTGCMSLDVGTQRLIDIERLADAVVEHAEPIAAWLLQLSGSQQVAGLHDDLERVGEIVGKFANFQRKIFRNLCGASL